MAKRVSDYGPGSLFACPFPRGGWGAGLVVRWTEDDPIGLRAVVLYGFDGVHERQPTFEDVASKTIYDAVHIGHSQCHPLRKGQWPVLGKLPGFKLDDWPEPAAIRDERLQRVSWTQLWNAQRKPEPPFEMGDENIEVPKRMNKWDSVLLDARKYLKPSEFHLFPPRLGLCVNDAFATDLERAIVERHPLRYIKIDKKTLAAWERLRKTLREKRIAYLGD